MIRSGREDDLDMLQEVERSAGQAFADYSMSVVAEDDPLPVEVLAEYCHGERLWVAADGSDHPVAYLIADIVDGLAHIEQVSVHADHAGNGLGRWLIETVIDWAKEQSLSAVTLTTFSEVPWNRPYYERLGFQVIPETEYSPGLRTIRQQEKEHGLDEWPRVCMRLNVQTASSPSGC